jgi:hypothetical protein
MPALDSRKLCLSGLDEKFVRIRLEKDFRRKKHRPTPGIAPEM